jgi:hypothetical protein
MALDRPRVMRFQELNLFQGEKGGKIDLILPFSVAGSPPVT